MIRQAVGIVCVTLVGLETAAEAPELYIGYDPSPAYPHGRLHPDAPPETAQFEFMLGELDCTDQLRNPDGTWRKFPAIVTSNIRVFDSRAGVWKVSWFKMPGYGSGVWEGKKEDDRLVMRQPTTLSDEREAESRLTFFDISPRDSNGSARP